MTGPVYYASGNGELLVALKAAALTGGTIKLAAGHYDRIYYSNVSSPGLLITSADPANPAQIDGVSMTRVNNVTLAGLEIGRPLLAGENITTAYVTVCGCRNVNMVGLDVHGSLDGDASNDGYGIRIDGSSDVTVADSDFHQLNRAVIVMRSSDAVLSGNDITQTREGFGLGVVDHVVIEKNDFHGLTPAFQYGDHPDCIQFMTANLGSSSHVLIRDNAMINGDSAPVQGIFMRSTEPGIYGFSDFTITNNLYYGGSRHGISVGYCDGLTVQGNTILASPTPELVPALNITQVSNASFSGNISPLYLVDGANLKSFGTNDLIVASSKSPTGLALDDLFMTPPTGIDPLLDSFATEAGVHAGFIMGDGIGGDQGDPLALMGQYDALHQLALSLGSQPILG